MHATSTESNHPHFPHIPNLKRKFYSVPCRQDLSLCETDTHMYASLKTSLHQRLVWPSSATDPPKFSPATECWKGWSRSEIFATLYWPKNQSCTYSVLRTNSQTTSTYDFIIMVKACAEPITLFGRVKYRELVHNMPQGPPKGRPEVLNSDLSFS